MRKRKFSAALIGTGRIGFSLGFDKKREQPASHTMALNANKRISLDFACDSNKTNLEYWYRFNKRKAVYSDVSHLFASSNPDIVVIAVNEESHFSVCLSAIHSKPKLIILEKPIALSVEEGMKILEESEDYCVPILVNHERRFAEDYKIAKNYINKIGDIISVNARLDSGLCVYNPEEENTGSYSLFHDGTHLIDCVMYLLEDFSGDKNVLYNTSIVNIVYDQNKQNIVNNLSVHFQSDKCKDVFVSLSGKCKYFGFEIDIIGTEGRIRIGNGIFELYKRVESILYTGFYSLILNKKIKAPKKTKYFSNMVQNAVDFLDGKEYLKSSIKTGLNTLEVLESIKNKIKK